MARRYYMSPVETVTDAVGRVVRQPRVTTLLGRQSPQSIVYPAAGSAASWCLVLIDAPDHTAALGDAAVDPLPDLGLDAALSTLPTKVRNDLFAALDRRGVDRTGVGTTTPFRQVVRRAGQALEPTYDETNAI